MEIQYFGANCVRLTSKKASVIIDDNLSSLGAKQVTKSGEIALYTTNPDQIYNEAKVTITEPGEYEVSDISIHGIASRAHMDAAGACSATMFKITMEDVRIAVAGHVYPELSSNQLETLGIVDVLIIPIGGNGFTLDAVGALKLIKEIEPKIIIPTHFADSSLKYEVPQQSLKDAIKELSFEAQTALPKLKLKAGEFPETTQLIVLEK